AAHARHGDAVGARDRRDELLHQAREWLADESAHMDYPVLGCVVTSLGIWQGASGDPEGGARLVGLGEGLSLNRMLPSLDPYDGDLLVDLGVLASCRAEHAGRRPAELRDAVATLLSALSVPV
ncbi:MAG: hypothetical protein QM572_09550, partial [Nocardioides sp.]|uniref:hypothetical protein n=1 Tax=Nocardioides sp. TaxID=35761 RepID=UPI0039E5F665